MKIAFISFLKASQPWWVTARGMGIQSAPSKDISCLFLPAHPHHFKSLCRLQPQCLSPVTCCPCVTQTFLTRGVTSGVLVALGPCSTQCCLQQGHLCQLRVSTANFHKPPHRSGSFLHAGRNVQDLLFLACVFNVFLHRSTC